MLPSIKAVFPVLSFIFKSLFDCLMKHTGLHMERSGSINDLIFKMDLCYD